MQWTRLPPQRMHSCPHRLQPTSSFALSMTRDVKPANKNRMRASLPARINSMQ
jgi:hypothetical protein